LLVELPSLEDAGEPGLVTFCGDGRVHNAALYKPHLYQVPGDDFALAQ
jgi:hypothetical protein